MQAGNDFFNTAGTATGSVVNNQAAPPAPITGATPLSGAAGTDSLRTSFAAGDTITVNGTPITFVASGATGNQLNVTDSVQTLLSKIDSITGTSTPSTVSGGVIDAAHRQRREPVGHEFEHGRVRQRSASAAPRVTATAAAAAGLRLAVELRDVAGQRHAGQHRVLVHRQSRAGIGARIVDRADRFVGHGSVRRAGQ